jgi:hypothetical protein
MAKVESKVFIAESRIGYVFPSIHMPSSWNDQSLNSTSFSFLLISCSSKNFLNFFHHYVLYYFFKDMANKLEEKIIETHKKKIWNNLKDNNGS